MHALHIPIALFVALLTFSITPALGSEPKHLFALIVGSKQGNCENPEEVIRTTEVWGDGRCRSFMSPWKSLLGQVQFDHWEHPEKDAAATRSYGNCSLHLYKGKHCRGSAEVGEVTDLNQPTPEDPKCWYSESSGVNFHGAEGYKGPVQSVKMLYWKQGVEWEWNGNGRWGMMDDGMYLLSSLLDDPFSPPRESANPRTPVPHPQHIDLQFHSSHIQSHSLVPTSKLLLGHHFNVNISSPSFMPYPQSPQTFSLPSSTIS
ncbi:hypothetical protein DOTSEDRAFT_39590 [Dothistroma septosporum NZE10]|uniref:Ecp2 effector protein domain-containing protein n=1 Tax=Dothistroma septosporum (strain NZE10 / CBS 128990) TaxID=675120 RepID=M2XZC1_DOTSN|nr:hypothetical protein DOTSEDRAFT_39590 [Dothistroma septosporum NZE10]